MRLMSIVIRNMVRELQMMKRRLGMWELLASGSDKVKKTTIHTHYCVWPLNKRLNGWMTCVGILIHFAILEWQNDSP